MTSSSSPCCLMIIWKLSLMSLSDVMQQISLFSAMVREARSSTYSMEYTGYKIRYKNIVLFRSIDLAFYKNIFKVKMQLKMGPTLSTRPLHSHLPQKYAFNMFMHATVNFYIGCLSLVSVECILKQNSQDSAFCIGSFVLLPGYYFPKAFKFQK